MRGNRALKLADGLLGGSIPAHAGEPWAKALSAQAGRVYPRACGGTTARIQGPMDGMGLSPRMRGNPSTAPPGTWSGGSIPAHAGEPDHALPGAVGLRVYPRACGGTEVGARSLRYPKGLSPRMRGNRHARPRHGFRMGSIPAHAGEPGCLDPVYARDRVYPRACAGNPTPAHARGTQRERGCRGVSRGLSPRMRGNRPRACGGTGGATWLAGPYGGLSPRMRGNPQVAAGRDAALGSIPAHAGEPRLHFPGIGVAGVYPRACGGTAAFAKFEQEVKGLSPRMRGNLGVVLGDGHPHGSIPRACGGTLDLSRRNSPS